MPKRVQPGLVGADFLSVGVFDAFADHSHAILVGVHRLLDFGQELLVLEGQFGQQDDVRGVGRIASLGQYGSGSDPSSRAAHDLDDATRPVVGGHAGHVNSNFHDRRGVVLDDGAVARTIVRVWQVIVDGFGNANDSQLVTAL